MIIAQNQENKIKQVLQMDNHFAVTDSNVYALYSDYFTKNTFVIEPGESNKNLVTVEKICEFLREHNANRKSTLVAVGGGVVGDITGFCASIYMRGIEWINVPTTLLALTDSGIGGKTGVDLHNYKNMIGSFHFPKEIYSQANFVKTLPQREYVCGIGEVIKTSALDKDIFDFYIQNEQKILDRDEDAIFQVINLCTMFKDNVVTIDPHEKTITRKSLNYGHTLGHAIETADEHKLSHGEYILNGMILEAKIFRSIIDKDYYNKIIELSSRALNNKFVKFDIQKVATMATSDKKNYSDNISFVVVAREGKFNEQTISKEDLIKKLEEIN